jgi:hypothetical protein
MKETTGFLMVNQTRVIDAGCSACGDRFATKATGERALMLNLGEASDQLFFCDSCGDNIIAHLNTEDAVKRYQWDWAIPLRNSSGNAKGWVYHANGSPQDAQESA